MRTFYNYRVMRQWSSLQPNYKASKFSKVILIIQMPKKKKAWTYSWSRCISMIQMQAESEAVIS